MSGLSTWGIARKNLQRRPWRSFCLVLVILLLSFFLFSGSVLSFSLSRGAENAANRLGADIMVVPEGFDPHIDNILLSVKPSRAYLPGNVMERLKGFEAVAQMSPQTFLVTLNASCCAYPLQLMGIDYDTDFIVKSWLDATLRRELRDGEIIIGANVSGAPGETIYFFGKDLTIAGRLERTGMKFDAMVFMNYPTIAMLAREAERITHTPLAEDGSLISTVMLKLKPGQDSVATARAINKALNSEGIYALFSKKFVTSIGESLTMVSWIIRGSLLLFWILAVIIVALIFAVTLAERRREMGVLRALGASRGKLLRLCLAEVFLISLYGATLGVALGGVAVAAGSPVMTGALHLPFLLPPLLVLSLLALASAGAAVLTGLFAAGWSAVRASRADIHEIMRYA